DLLTQVTRHKELLRGHWAQSQRREPDALARHRELRQAAASTPAAGRVAARPQPAVNVVETGLEKWVNANLPRLEQYVDHELQSRVLAGQTREDQISRKEVGDEVMVSALPREARRTGLLSPESWFHRLALQAIRRLTRANADPGPLSHAAPA